MYKLPKPSLRTLCGRLSVSLTMLWMLSACSTIVVKEVPVGPPVALYSMEGQTPPETLQRGASNADLVRYAQHLKDRLRAAYDDREAIRLWAVCALETKVKNDGCK